MTSYPSSRPMPLDSRYYVGCDLGQSIDPTAIAVVRRIEGEPERPLFQVGHLERLPLNTPYPGVVSHVRDLLPRLPGEAELVIDLTGVGRPVFDLFEARGMSAIGVTITAGDSETREGLQFHVPKITLISRLQALLHDRRLHILKTLPEAPVLVAELQDFKATVTDSGYWKFGARSGKHDDLVLALAIAVWRAHTTFAGQGLYEWYRENYGSPSERSAGSDGAFTEPTVTLRAPPGISNASTISGKNYAVAQDGTIQVPAGDAQPLIGAGWQRIGAEQPNGSSV